MKKKWLNYLPLILCGVFLWGVTLADFLTPDREYSEMENRYLMEQPTPTLRSVWNNVYTIRYEEYTNDQFVGRDGWITLKSLGETALGKQENNGVVYGADDYMFDKIVAIDETQMWKNIGFVKAFGEKYPDQDITLTLIPNSYSVLEDKLPRGLHNIDQEGYIRELYREGAQAGLAVCDILPVLREHREEYIYYRTDHHWTTRGAWLAYAQFSRQAGNTPVDLGTLVGNQAEDFYGTYYSKAKLYSAVPDIITWYDVPVSRVEIDGEEAEGIYDLEKLEERDKYAVFLRGNNGLTVIDSGVRQEEGEPSRILVFKDSYGNSLAPFLLHDYHQVYVVDLRYYNEVEALMEEVAFDQVYILYNFDSFTSDTHLAKLQ